MTQEANFDGIVGPTHHYGGLAYGNVASAASAGQVSRPKEAALQGLAKMKAMMDLGLVQGILPPHERPHIPTLRAMGFTGSDGAVLSAVHRTDPGLLEAAASASSMWVANAATVSPSADTGDGKLHFTVANLASQFHRSIEAPQTKRILDATFPDEDSVVVHPALPAALGDEGAANHTRLAAEYGAPGVELFVYGTPGTVGPGRYPSRQHRRASETVARRHCLDPDRTVLIQQSPDVIDQGIFHNDVIAVGNLDLLFFHERSFVGWPETERTLQALLPGLRMLRVREDEVSVDHAVRTYLFNSQLVNAGGETILVAPQEVRDDPTVWQYVSGLVGQGLDRILIFDLRQSMRNGGGPACLRLRVVLTDRQERMVNRRSLLTDELHGELVAWVHRYYREELEPKDLADPELLTESRLALDELTQLLALGSIYDFQR